MEEHHVVKIHEMTELLAVSDDKTRDFKNKYIMIDSKFPSQLLTIDEDKFGNTEIEKLILERLQQAANDPEIRKLMDAEDRLLAALYSSVDVPSTN